MTDKPGIQTKSRHHHHRHHPSPPAPNKPWGISSAKTVSLPLSSPPLRRPRTSQVHEQAGRFAAAAAVGALLLADPLKVGVIVVVVVVVLLVLDLEHDFLLALALDESDLGRVLPQHVLLPLGHPALDEDVAGFL